MAPCEVTHSPKQLSTSSHEAGDEYSSEASEIDTQSTVSYQIVLIFIVVTT